MSVLLKWTARGAVLAPETLQIRVSPVFPSRMAAGAPVSRRALSGDEIDANVRWFATPGPRGRPISGLVLSGVDGDAGHRILAARALGVARIVVHADPGRARAVEGADAVAVTVRTPDDARDLAGIAHLDLVVPLDVADLGETIAAVRPLGARRIGLTWPFPVAGAHPPPPAAEVVARIASVEPALEGLPWTIKGLPACVLPPSLHARIGRTSNRWYVDADHQRDRALLFVPDVLAFAKREACRFCDLDARCDGVAERWLLQGLVGPLVPLR